MEAIITRMLALPEAGVEIAACIPSVLNYFGTLRELLLNDKTIQVDPTAFFDAICEIRIQYLPNRPKNSGFTLLIHALARLEEMELDMNQKMTVKMTELVDLAEVAYAAYTAGLLLPAGEMDMKAVDSKSNSGRSNFEINNSTRPIASTSKIAVAVNASTLPKRPLVDLESEQQPKRIKKDNETPLLTLPAMIATAILSTSRKRATIKEINIYLKGNFLECMVIQFGVRWYPKLLPCLKLEECFGLARTEVKGSSNKKGKAKESEEFIYWIIKEGSFRGPFEPKVRLQHFGGKLMTLPERKYLNWKLLISKILQSNCDEVMTLEGIITSLISTDEYFKNLELDLLTILVKVAISKYCTIELIEAEEYYLLKKIIEPVKMDVVEDSGSDSGEYSESQSESEEDYSEIRMVKAVTKIDREEFREPLVDEEEIKPTRKPRKSNPAPSLRPTQTWLQMVQECFTPTKFKLTSAEICNLISEKYSFFQSSKRSGLLSSGTRTTLSKYNQAQFKKNGESILVGNKRFDYWILIGKEEGIEVGMDVEGSQADEETVDSVQQVAPKNLPVLQKKPIPTLTKSKPGKSISKSKPKALQVPPPSPLTSLPQTPMKPKSRSNSIIFSSPLSSIGSSSRTTSPSSSPRVDRLGRNKRARGGSSKGENYYESDLEEVEGNLMEKRLKHWEAYE